MPKKINPVDGEVVVKLKRGQTPPKEWRDAGASETLDHVRVHEVEETEDGEAWRLKDSYREGEWVLSKTQVQDIRPPGHPARPD